MYFSIKTQGFYVGDLIDKNHMPDDVVEVNADVEKKIRNTILDCNRITAIKGTKITSEKLDTLPASNVP